MQLVAYGAQDIYLTGQPQITFFKAVYRRHTNFAIESIQQTIQGSPGFGTRVEVTASRNGDLILNANVQLDTVSGGLVTANNKVWSYENFFLFDRVEMEIGGQQVDRIYADWMALYAELVYRQGYSLANAGPGTGAGADALGTALNNVKTVAGGGAINLPLLFYFNNNPGLAVPLISLQYHEVKFILFINTQALLIPAAAGAPAPSTGTVVQMCNSLAAGSALGVGGEDGVGSAINNMKFYIDYAYLDTTERRKFAQNAHEYLITQHQRIDIEATTNDQNIRLDSLNHPVKYLAWRFWSGSAAPNAPLECLTYTDAKITFNGSDRFTTRPSNYFENMQVHQFWPCGGNQLTYASNGMSAGSGGVDSGKWSLYSFALRPAEHQPSGTCNFSRIDTSNLVVTAPDTGTDHFTLHAENYNVLRVMSGMGGLAYSN